MRLRPAQLIILLTSLLLSGSLTVRSQELRAVLSHYSAEDGMTSNTISDIKTDAYGFIWIASWNGFSRFDGYEFYNYPTGNASGIPLMHNRIAELCIDNVQNVWLRMYDGRVFVLNRKTDTIINPLQDIPGYESFMTDRCLFANKKGEGEVEDELNELRALAPKPKETTDERPVEMSLDDQMKLTMAAAEAAL